MPAGERLQCLALDSAGRSGFKRKNSQGRDPRTHQRTEHSQLQADEHTQPQGDRETIHTRTGDENGSEETANKRAQCIRRQTHYTRQDRGDGERSQNADVTERKTYFENKQSLWLCRRATHVGVAMSVPTGEHSSERVPQNHATGEPMYYHVGLRGR